MECVVVRKKLMIVMSNVEDRDLEVRNVKGFFVDKCKRDSWYGRNNSEITLVNLMF